MLIFRSEEHIDRWCSARDLPRGAILTPERVWRLAHAWYRDKVKPEWRRHTLEETEALFAALGLEGSFWSSRPGA